MIVLDSLKSTLDNIIVIETARPKGSDLNIKFSVTELSETIPMKQIIERAVSNTRVMFYCFM